MVLGVSLAARAAWSVRAGDRRGLSANGANGMGIALGVGLAFWGILITTITTIALVAEP
ncbi:hypothetical protein NKG05_08330 [Oerskovia sp. M15]